MREGVWGLWWKPQGEEGVVLAVTEPWDELKDGMGGVVPKREEQAKGTETRSQLFDDADRTN